MDLSRRHLLVLGALGVTGASLAGCRRGDSGGGATGESGSSASLQFTWWGNEVRNANTAEAIDAYMEENPEVTVEPQPGEWASYWDRLATQTAGNNAPDVIQMDMAYISEYGQRGALLDLEEHGADTSKFTEGTADAGVIDGTLYGINAGVNTPTVLINPQIFDELGVEIPDDMTWTWDDWRDLAAGISDSGEVIGSSGIVQVDAMFSAWLRQRDKELFVEGNQVGFDVEDVRAWFEMGQEWADVGATPGPSQMTEDVAKPLDQQDYVVGRTAMAMVWSNQLQAVETSGGNERRILRFPSIAGDATERKAWYKASMLWSASATTENPEAAVALINWWMNSQTAAEIELAERGVPPNAEISTAIRDQLSDPQQRVSRFIEDIVPELSATPIAPPPGGGQVGTLLQRYGFDMLFGNTSSADAAQGFYDELTAGL